MKLTHMPCLKAKIPDVALGNPILRFNRVLHVYSNVVCRWHATHYKKIMMRANRKLTRKFSIKDYMLLITVNAQIREQDAYVNF